jgi:hypothetical protein
MSLITSGEVIVAYGQNGEMLRPENGYPLRLVVPGVQGVSWVKYLRRVEVGDMPYAAKDEAVHYMDLQPGGLHRQYTNIQECKSVVTTPSGGQVLLDPHPHSPALHHHGFCLQGEERAGVHDGGEGVCQCLEAVAAVKMESSHAGLVYIVAQAPMPTSGARPLESTASSVPKNAAPSGRNAMLLSTKLPACANNPNGHVARRGLF